MDDLYMLLGGFFIACLLISIVVYVLLIVANWKIYTKAGEAGWKSLIPFYSQYILFKITWNVKMFWATLVTAFLYGLFVQLGENNDVMLVFAGIAAVAVAVINVMQLYKMSKAFGHGAGFTIGLMFLPNVMTLILGFGKSEYQGPQ